MAVATYLHGELSLRSIKVLFMLLAGDYASNLVVGLLTLIDPFFFISLGL